MKEYAQTINLVNDPDKIKEYLAYHEAVWPEVIEGLKKIGILSMNIYHIGTQLFMVMTTTDEFNPDTDYMTYLEHSPRCKEWEDKMGEYQAIHPDAKDGEKWALMTKVFEL